MCGTSPERLDAGRVVNYQVCTLRFTEYNTLFDFALVADICEDFLPSLIHISRGLHPLEIHLMTYQIFIHSFTLYNQGNACIIPDL